LFSRPEIFVCERLRNFSPPEENVLKKIRRLSVTVQNFKRYDVKPEKALNVGSQIIFHYELALSRIGAMDSVLDMACGTGWGVNIMAKVARHVTGIDLDVGILPTDLSNATFCAADVNHTGFADATFDAVTAFEILEHITPETCLAEARRVLRPGGRFMLSTPQNSLGKIPFCPAHVREYSLDELLTIVSRFFEVEEIIGIKQGRIVIPGDPIGQNTFLCCRKTMQ
jgi:2-polyprenyl-3-methyl-5-hydroxy-6-metoxy-1,4-benzoquinol methylase